MGFGIKELLIILVIVILLFGTKKLKTIGSDLGGAIKGFRKSLNDDTENSLEDQTEASSESQKEKQSESSQS